MEPKVELVPDPRKTLADFPMISATYRAMPTNILLEELPAMKRRAAHPTTDWDKKFAALHAEAIDNELKEPKAVAYLEDLKRFQSGQFPT